MGGRGSSGKASSGARGVSPEEQLISNLKVSSKFDTDGSSTRARLMNPEYAGTLQLVELLGSGRSFKDFEKSIGVTQSELTSAVSSYHPGKSIKLTKQAIKRDKYARGGGTPAKTRFFISIE